MSHINPVEVAARWNAADTSPPPRARHASPTVAKLQDQVFQTTMALLQGLAAATAGIMAADRLFDQLRADGLQGEMVSNIDQDGCTVCITVQVERFGLLTHTLESLGYDWEVRDMHHSTGLNIVTLSTRVSGEMVFISATAPVIDDALVLRAA